MTKWHRNHIPHISATLSSTLLCYIQNATLLTFMPPFILIYMYMFELIFNFTAPSIWKIQRKRQNTDWILKQLSKERKKKSVTEEEKKIRTPVLEVWKNISVKNLFYRCGIPWAESPFWSDAEQYHKIFFFPFTVSMKRSEYIYTTLTLHKYRNNNYCT